MRRLVDVVAKSEELSNALPKADASTMKTASV